MNEPRPCCSRCSGSGVEPEYVPNTRPSRHKKALRRRLEYLRRRSRGKLYSSISYDRGEISALEWVLNKIEQHEKALEIVEEQERNEDLWSPWRSEAEALLQKELTRLHTALEKDKSDLVVRVRPERDTDGLCEEKES